MEKNPFFIEYKVDIKLIISIWLEGREVGDVAQQKIKNE